MVCPRLDHHGQAALRGASRSTSRPMLPRPDSSTSRSPVSHQGTDTSLSIQTQLRHRRRVHQRGRCLASSEFCLSPVRTSPLSASTRAKTQIARSRVARSWRHDRPSEIGYYGEGRCHAALNGAELPKVIDSGLRLVRQDQHRQPGDQRRTSTSEPIAPSGTGRGRGRSTLNRWPPPRVPLPAEGGSPDPAQHIHRIEGKAPPRSVSTSS